MKAIGLYRYLPTSDPDCFVEVDLPTPRPTGHDLLVRVEAVSVNPVDTKQRAPRPDVERDPKILGWDAAGVVAAVGDAVTLFQPGDEVYYAGSLVRPGCNSELHLVDERIVGHKPRSLTMAQAAAMPLTTITAWEALFVRMGIEPRTAPEEPARTILIIAGAGGVGSIAIQLAKQVAGLQVVATASRAETSAWCEAMGADHVVNHHQPLEAELQRIGIAQVDYIFCCSHLEQYIEQMPAIIAPFGFVCSIVGMKDGQPLPLGGFFGKSVAFAFELMYTRSMFQMPDMVEQHHLLDEVGRLIDSGKIRHTMTEHVGSLSADHLRQAHAKVESGTMIGKLVLDGINVAEATT
ncbi:MAG: zinc-binding alcohol dehydrogenase family protein [Caldilineaceae bacterium]|nr:zinc-binding alcohol dehydrogenase family protein [Caldilineaceae bacterium]